jgi:hypothetical protein
MANGSNHGHEEEASSGDGWPTDMTFHRGAPEPLKRWTVTGGINGPSSYRCSVIVTDTQGQYICRD